MKNTASFLYLAPRFLGTLLVLLIFAFLLEVTAEEFEILLFLKISLPGTLILLLLIIGWLNEKIGGWLFVITAILTILYSFATTPDFNIGFLILPGWSLLVGLLFLASKHLCS